LWDSTVVVLIAMLLIGGYIAAFDLFFINIVGFLTKP
jgi:preprotein translocase subunit SecE